MPQAQTVALPKRLPLVVRPENRNDTTSKDAKLINCYMEKSDEGEWHIYKRPGLARYSQPSGGAAAGQGIFNWKGAIYSVFGGQLYKDLVAKGAVNSAGGVYRFSSCLGATPKLQLGNGIKAYNYDDSNGLVEITDVDFPTSFVKGWSFLNGTTYVMRTDAGIQGDDINTPTDWDPVNLIFAQIEPDQGVALAKQLVYTIALKQWSVEVFYDAGNPTGSPLGTVQGAKQNMGCVTQDSVQDVEGTLLWLATNREGGAHVCAMTDLKLSIISTKPVERLLSPSDWTNTYSWHMNNSGHRFYGITSVNSNLSLVYDLDEQAWWQITDSAGNYYPIVSMTYTGELRHLGQHATNGRIYEVDMNHVTDDGAIITSDIYTPNFDAGVENRGKLVSRLGFVADQTTGSALLVRTNDFDYDPRKWTNFREISLEQQLPYLTDMGTFYRRAHHFRHDKATRMRLSAVEVQMDLCTL